MDRTKEFKEAFALFDKDADGLITTKELGTVLRAIGKSPTDAEVKALVAEVDPDGKGFLDINQWLVAATKDIKTMDSDEDLKSAWRLFDREGKGFITTAELRHVLGNIGEALSPDELDDLIKETDPEGTGKVPFDEFMKLVKAK